MKTENDAYKLRPSSRYRFFVFDPHDGFLYFPDREARDAYARDRVEDYLDPDCGWDELVEDIAVGELTGVVEAVERRERPPDEELDEDECDEDGRWWGQWDFWVRYEVVGLEGPPTDEPEPAPDIGDGQPEEPPYVRWVDGNGLAAYINRTHWREPVVWQALYRAVKRGDGDTAERIWAQLPREGRRMHLPGLWGQPETRAWLEEKGVDISMRWEAEDE